MRFIRFALLVAVAANAAGCEAMYEKDDIECRRKLAQMRKQVELLPLEAGKCVRVLRINCSQPPYTPEGFVIDPADQLNSAVCDQVSVDPSSFSLHFVDGQMHAEGLGMSGVAVRAALEGKRVLDAHVLDALLADTASIPESWKVDENGSRRFIFFWGTIYRGMSNNLVVRYLYWYEGAWMSQPAWIGHKVFGETRPAATVP